MPFVRDTTNYSFDDVKLERRLKELITLRRSKSISTAGGAQKSRDFNDTRHNRSGGTN